jgi:prevent-host-death family protein
MKIAVSEFKSKCTKILRDVAKGRQSVEITKRGKVMAIVSPVEPEKELDPKEFLGCLHGTVSISPGWDEPLGEDDWEASK